MLTAAPWPDDGTPNHHGVPQAGNSVWESQRVAILNRNNQPGYNPAVVFLGDSITQLWTDPNNGKATWDSRIAQFNPANDGIGGDTSLNVLYRVQNHELDNLHPQVVVLGIGTNDFGQGVRTPADVQDTVRYTMNLIHAILPNTKILLIGVPPVGSPTSNTAYVEPPALDYDQHYLPYLATPYGFRNTNSYPNTDLSLDIRFYLSANQADPNNYYANPNWYAADLVHPNATGYALYADAIATPLRLMLHRQLVPGDYDGDGKTDIAAYLPGSATFAVRPSAGGTDQYNQLGYSGTNQTIPVVGDFDGDGRTDLGVYVPSSGAFAIHESFAGDVYFAIGTAGAGQSIPAVGDYDGDGLSDMAVYVPASGQFQIRRSSTGQVSSVAFGSAGYGASIPAPGDYDGDGRTDLAVYMPALGAFGVRPSAGGSDQITSFGSAGYRQSIPAPGDYDGDGKTDLAVYNPYGGAYGIIASSTGQGQITYFGAAGYGASIPAPGDYDGDGRTDLAVYMPAYGAFGVRPSKGGSDQITYFGASGYGQVLPVTARYDLALAAPLGAAAPAGAQANATPASGGSTIAAAQDGPAVARKSAPAATSSASPTVTIAAARPRPTRVAQAIPAGPESSLTA